jgi:hypothetical protein
LLELPTNAEPRRLLRLFGRFIGSLLGFVDYMTKTRFIDKCLLSLLIAVLSIDCPASAEEVKTKIEKLASEYRQLAATYRKNRSADNISNESDALRLKLGKEGKALVAHLLKDGASEHALLRLMGSPSARLPHPNEEINEPVYLYFGERVGRYIFITCKQGQVHSWTEKETSDHD